MPRIQFGWTLPSIPPKSMSQNAYIESVQKGFEVIKGHFDSFWFVDHLQSDEKALLEGWTALTYFAGLHPDFVFGHVVLCQSFRNPALVARMAATVRRGWYGGCACGRTEDEVKWSVMHVCAFPYRAV